MSGASFYLPNYFPMTGVGGALDAQGFAYGQATEATKYIDALRELAKNLNAPDIIPIFPTVGSAPVPVGASLPTFEAVTWEMPDKPEPFTGSLDVSDILPDTFDEEPPSLNFGAAPVPFNEALPAAPGVDTNFAYPADLSISLPAPPALLSLSVSRFQGVNMPSIDYTIPELTVVAPEPLAYVPQEHYTSNLLGAMQAELLDRIQNGGTGLNPDVENAIWDRGREREARAMREALDQIDRMEGMGFSLPPGVWLDARLKVATENAAANMGLSREIMIKQAELEMQNVQNALQQAGQLEQALISYTNQREQRAFEAYRYLSQAQIEIYNAKVRAYGVYVDAYKTKVAIYEAQVRGELAKVEAYKAEISAEEAKAQINTALVNQYKVQADVALANVEIYKAKIDAIRSKAEIERLKVEIFGEQVRGYTAKVNAYTAQVEGFRASVQAEASKQEAFKAQVAAYSAEVDAASKIIQARIDEYRANIEVKQIEWEGYKALAQAESSKAQAIASNNSSLADAFRAEVSGIASYNQAMTQQWEASVRQAQVVAEIGVSAAKANADAYLTAKSISTDAAKVGAQVASQLGAAALSTLNWSTSYNNSYSAQESVSRSWSYNESKSESV